VSKIWFTAGGGFPPLEADFGNAEEELGTGSSAGIPESAARRARKLLRKEQLSSVAPCEKYRMARRPSSMETKGSRRPGIDGT
jgi:hypothetical protein